MHSGRYPLYEILFQFIIIVNNYTCIFLWYIIILPLTLISLLNREEISIASEWRTNVNWARTHIG